MNYVIYLFFRLMVFINRFVPFFVFYYFADIIYVFLYYVFKYRRNVVRQNLNRVFPDKSNQEIHQITKKFYHNLADIMLESIKGFSAKKEEMIKRYKVINPEIMNKYFNAGKDVILLGAHYTNWEWGALATGSQVQHHMVALYKPLSNKYIDQYMKKRRAAWNMELASIYRTSRVFDHDYGKPKAVIMLADQCPTKLDQAYFVDFLGQNTACLHGPEKYGRRKNLPLLYANMQRVKRGYYTVRIEKLSDNPAALKEGEITEIYMQHLENIIRRQPENWLWSHRRWKRTRERKHEKK
ncbi:MAG: lysophospholipid acyltransferase family protein [Fidelibacterota bacterium]